jgi:predicted translin family RNA/ssDNA-binding protein
MSTEKHRLLSIFASFRDHLDDQHDRRERLIKVRGFLTVSPFTSAVYKKVSRDVTILSKKVIFFLHRILTEEAVDTRQSIAHIAQRAHPKFRQVQALFSRLKDDLQGEQIWKYQKQISPGLQEYIEALGFAHYLEHGTLISLAQVQSSLCDEAGVPVCLLCYDMIISFQR